MWKEQMAGTRFDPIAHAKAMREAGFWVDKSYDEFLQGTIARTPDKLALIADRSDRSEKRRFSYAELGDVVARAAASLKRLGVGRGDIISVQLPNWWEFAVVVLAAFRVGAVVNPLMPLPRTRIELHPRLRRDQSACGAAAFSWLRPRRDGEIASAVPAEA
jgi:cyclohexanecarboxylate-CoA ligase